MADNLQVASKRSQSEPHKQAIISEARANFVLEQCCFCCIPLRIGSLILAYLYLVATLISLIFTTLALVAISIFVNDPDTIHHRTELIQALAISSVVELLTMFSLSFAIVLLIGLHKNKRNYVKIFIIFLLVCIVINVIQRLVTLVLFAEKRVVDAITILLYIFFNIYFVVVLRSHYLELGGRCNNLPGHLHRDGHLSPKV
ncbi:uncharacterized protein LOC112054417 [Bicyclus anynana]|uniref:Uncharacterized protein LOC112054417 n=1 Tax=Bicyclus anynana TaxID=110368 RepID=A0ABM3LSD7_BICAN|nr:uncharacterized protein LOC112054417 [Bicyclus anynana]